MEEIQSNEPPPLFDNIDFNTSEQDYEIFESAVQQVIKSYEEFLIKTIQFARYVFLNLTSLC